MQSCRRIFPCSDLHINGRVRTVHAYVYARGGIKKTFASEVGAKVFSPYDEPG